MELLVVGILIAIVLFIIGAPIFLAMIVSASFIYFFALHSPPDLVAHNILMQLNRYAFLSLPFFILAGNLMSRGKAAKALIDFVEAFIGQVPGALAIAVVISCALFAALNGSTLATSAAIGAVMLKPMTEKGYPLSFTCGLIASMGVLGIIIPPSIAMIIYSGITDTSIPSMFLAGVLPGLLLVVMLSFVVYFISKRRGYVSGEHFTWPERWRALLHALPALGIIVIIMGGIYSGTTTATESAAVSCIYALLVGKFYYKSFTWKSIAETLVDATRTTSLILIIAGCALVFGSALISAGISEMLTNFVVTYMRTWWVFLLAINLVWLGLGCVMESTAVMLIMVPLIFASLAPMGINPIHFGILTVVNTEIALITPPIGMNLYLMSGIAKVPVETVYRGVLPYVITFLIGLIIITYIPAISLFLPTITGWLH